MCHKIRKGKRGINNFDQKGVSSNIYSEEDTSGCRVYNSRIKKNLSINQLANLSGVCTISITNVELNRRPLTLKALSKISIVLDEPISYLGAFESMPCDTIGQKLKKARYYQGHTQKEAAAIIGVNNDTIVQWEYGYSEPLKANLDKLEEYFSILSHV